jgi:hypothetical protein
MMIELKRLALALLLVFFTGFAPASLRAEDGIEKAGVGIGVTAGNLLFLPIKAITVTIGALSGALSYVVTGGNADLTRQIWQDTSEPPYVITPDVARAAIGDRPELRLSK